MFGARWFEVPWEGRQQWRAWPPSPQSEASILLNARFLTLPRFIVIIKAYLGIKYCLLYTINYLIPPASGANPCSSYPASVTVKFMNDL